MMTTVTEPLSDERMIASHVATHLLYHRGELTGLFLEPLQIALVGRQHHLEPQPHRRLSAGSRMVGCTLPLRWAFVSAL